MIKKLKQLLFVAMASSSLFTAGLVPALVVSGTAHADNIVNQVCSGTQDASGTTSSCDKTGNASGLKNVAANIVKIFSYIVGIIAVVMIIYGGFRYITSGGDSGKVGNAKNSLIYAIIGLVIVALAQFIVHFVLGTANGATGGNAL